MLFSKSAILGLLALVPFSEISVAADSKWARLEGCQWMENESNDGDSFHVRYRNKEFIFRLYFVDACESSEQIPARVQQQAKFIGIPPDRVLEAGKVAKEVTHQYLAGQSFTVVTRWEDAKGASRLPRNYAFVLFGKNDEHDLASTLVQNGLARIYGMPTDLPGSMSAAQFRNALQKLEAIARRQHRGVYGNLGAATSPAGSDVAGEVPPPGRPSTGGDVPTSTILPATSHPPDVVDNPADDELGDYAVQVTEAPKVIQAGIPDDNYSEIPGWKPSGTPAPAVISTEPPSDESPP